MNYTIDFKTKWADFDMNRHMRHTAYNDYAAEVRVRYFADKGFSVDQIAADGIGPILFSENTQFRKEIHSGETISINAKLSGLSTNQRKWKIRHEIFNQVGDLAAIVEVFGAWIDLNKRKLTNLPEKYSDLLDGIQKTNDFKEI